MPKRLSIWTKLAFGAGDLGPAVLTAINGFFLLEFLVNVAGLRPGPAGTIFLVTKIWDAVNDPVMGWLTDRTVSRWGRRRPWLLFGALPFGLAFWLHWIVPPLDTNGLFWYYLVVALLVDTGLTVVGVPYTALTPELTADYDERTSLNTYRFGFSILGGVLAAFFHSQIVAAFAPNRALGAAISVGFWAVLSTLGLWWTFLGTRGYAERPSSASEEIGFFEGMRQAFANRAFRLVTLTYLGAWLALQLVQGNLFIFSRDWLGMPEADFGFVLLLLQFTAFLAMLGWARLSARIGKRKVYLIGASLFVVTLIALALLPQGATTALYVLAVFGGVGVAVGYLVPWSMLPDVIDQDELEHGQRREGLFYAFFVFLQKLGLSLGLFASGWMLDLAGYLRVTPGQPVPIQPENVLLVLRLLVGPVGALSLLVSLWAVWRYPITREKHAEIRAELDRRTADRARSTAEGA
ncbi:MAG TPA: MFS transporter [Anaerolineales bacterium]|nr:MFS transporter [Anaerolineales bacterium]